MRITAVTVYRDSAAAIERASEQLADYQRQVASGKRVTRPSDDPDAAAAAIGERAEVAAVEQYTRTADSVTARLMVMDAALSDLVDRLSLAQATVVAAQGSTKAPVEREAAAQTLEGIKQALVASLNSSFRGAHLFAGANSLEPPYVMTGTTVGPYQGATQEVTVDLDPTRVATIGMNGSAIAQGSAARDLFATLDAAISAARAGDSAALGAAGAELAAAFDRATAAQLRVGTSLASLDALRTQLTDRRLAGNARIAKLEDADLAAAITGMNQADASYRAALATTGRITQLSLMDYLT